MAETELVVNDGDLVAKVRAALDESPDVDSLSIVVTLNTGVIELSGTISSHAERLAAIAVVNRAIAPYVVANRLDVRPVGAGWRRHDAEISDGIQQILSLLGDGARGVRFNVNQHVVTLDGTVGSNRQRSTLRHAVQSLPGVDFIENRLSVSTGVTADD